MNPVAKHFQKFNKNKVEIDRKKEVKKNGEALDIQEELYDDSCISQMGEEE